MSRFMLWIDGVGGYLICDTSTVAFGQPGNENVEVPIMADISRRHALLHRNGEHYLLEPLRTTLVDDRRLAASQCLATGATVTLGNDAHSGVGLRFTLPHPCGHSARLDLTSRHRFAPHADGVVLLADVCVVGPGAECHIRAPQAKRNLILHRRSDGSIVFRAAGSYDVDGRKMSDTSNVGRSSRIAADDFAWQLEPL